MSMRIGGLASGINTDELIAKLMKAERAPLDKMQQERQRFTWQRDSMRDFNKALDELKNLAFNMTLTAPYTPKKISSSMENAVTATGGSYDGTYEIQVSQLATRAMRVGEPVSKYPNEPLDAAYQGKTIELFTYKSPEEQAAYLKNNPSADPNSDLVKKNTDTITIEAGDTIGSILEKINRGSSNIRAFYDASSKKIVMETKRTGTYHPDGKSTDIDGNNINHEINFDDNGSGFFSDVLKVGNSMEKGGNNAKIKYNNELDIESYENKYVLNGTTFEFNDVTKDDKGNLVNARIVAQNDTEKAFENVMKFVDKYNEVIGKLNATQQERKYRDFPPLTDEQKKDMSEEQIKKWEEKAKSGMLRGDSIITGVLNGMRSSLYKKVDTNGQYNFLSQIGLETSSNYMDGGKIVLSKNNADKLKEALSKDPDAVYKLFNGSDNNPGLARMIRKEAETAMSKIDERAGKATATTLENDTLGKRVTDLGKRISDFEKRLTQVETRYWNQFNAMEKAVSRLNSQSSQMLSQFGGGM